MMNFIYSNLSFIILKHKCTCSVRFVSSASSLAKMIHMLPILEPTCYCSVNFTQLIYCFPSMFKNKGFVIVKFLMAYLFY